MRVFCLFVLVCAFGTLFLCSCCRKNAPGNLPLGIIGIEEPVYIEPFEKPFPAKMDTGADTSSIDAEDIRLIQRDGKDFVTFMIRQRDTGKEERYELPLKRKMRIVRHGRKSQPRYVVMLTIRIGGLKLEREFSLADRKNFRCQVLVGRNIISGTSAVDPSRQNLTGEL